MKRKITLLLGVAFVTFRLAFGAEAADASVLLAAVDSNNTRLAIPQLSADTNTGLELRRLIETNQPAVPGVSVVEKAGRAERQERNPLWVVLAVLAVLSLSYLFQRWRARSDPS